MLESYEKYVAEFNPNKWIGRKVNYNGTSDIGIVENAYSTSESNLVGLIVNWPDNAARANHTDSEHVTIKREI